MKGKIRKSRVSIPKLMELIKERRLRARVLQEKVKIHPPKVVIDITREREIMKNDYIRNG